MDLKFEIAQSVSDVGEVLFQDHLGEVVFVELPEAGRSVSAGVGFGAVESVKATSDVNSPISGDVVEVNSKLTESPGLVINLPFHLYTFYQNKTTLLSNACYN